MKIFIENEARSDQKNLFDEKTFEYRKTITVSRAYPYPYGFILDTTSGDGDNLDCFVLTKQKLQSGQTIECEAIGLMEQIEDGKEDHNVLARIAGEDAVVGEATKQALTDFVLHVFDHRPGKVVKVGKFLDKQAAEAYIQKSLDKE